MKTDLPRLKPYLIPLFSVITIAIVLMKINFYKTPSRTYNSIIFTDNYPSSNDIKKELSYIRTKKAVTTENEILVNRMVLAVSNELKMPPSILWCLLFQESRLNHLKNINEPYKAQGIGQFLNFSFYEINYELGKYTDDNLRMMINILGRDERPVLPTLNNGSSSYYFIPTGVVTTAAFLNNRYHQLEKNLNSKNISFDKELLWFYATISYNKGTRTLLKIWDDIQKKESLEYLEKTLNDKNLSISIFRNTRLLKNALLRIWKPPQAKVYAEELSTHSQKIAACSMELQND